MPVMSCRMDDKPGYKYGEDGHCYTYTQGSEASRKAAKRKAIKQGAAIEASKARSGQGSGKVEEFDNSLNDFIDRVRSAFDRQFRPQIDTVNGHYEYCWATDIYNDYLIARQGEKYYRVNMDVDDDTITFDERDEWEEVKLSYVAEMLPLESRRDVMLVYEIKGKYPDVPLADGVDYDELIAGDEDPVFVTLPIGKANVRSGNKRFYDEAFIKEFERQVLDIKPIGLMGHLSDAQRATEFPAEAVHWVGTKRVGDLLWGKGYLPPGEARARLRRYKSTNKKIATSIDATLEGIWDDSVQAYRMKADTLKLAQIDIAPADRAGIADLAAVPHLTSEMAGGEASAYPISRNYSQEDDMDRTQVIREMTADDAKILPEPVRQAVLQSAVPAPEVAQVQELRAALGLDDKADLKTVVTEMRKVQEEQRQAAIKTRIVELATPDPKRKPDEDKSIKIDAVRGVVIEMVNALEPKSIQEAEAAYDKIVASGPITELLKSKVVQTMGPPQGTPLQKQQGQNEYFQIPAEA